MNQGIFLVLEGTDGSGKGTQFKILADRLVAEGYDVSTFDFPQYDQPSSYFVREYLNGKYGSAEDVGPYTGSLFYALDRYEAAPQIKQALSEGKVVLCNRYVGSNMAHQGTKFDNEAERRGFFIWVDSLEFNMLGIPRPDMNFVLRVPADIAQQLVDQKDARGYTDKKRDLHEADLSHLQRAVEVYDNLCSLFPQDFSPISCVSDEGLMPIEAVSDIVWASVLPLLTAVPKAAKPSVTAQTVQPAATSPSDAPAYVTKNKNGSYSITEAGADYLRGAVTNTESNVYAFTGEMNPITIAAAMARLSRRGDDMRVTLLDEFAAAGGKDEKLLQRVITAYGDDSVQQLAGIHLVVENASNLLTKKLEWGRLASYLEQSTRYIFFDQKDKNGKYRYYVPEYLDKPVKKQYIETMDKIFDTYSALVRKLTEHVRAHSSVPEAERDGAWMGATRAQACDAIRPVLPVATTSTVGIFASGQALESLISHLLSDEMPEAHATGRKILTESRKVLASFLERIDRSERGVAAMGYRAFTYEEVKELATEYLPGGYSQDITDAVRLTSYWPKNELDLVPDMLYEHSHLSLKEIKSEAAKWPYEQKAKVFHTYMGERFNRRHRPGRALENAHYSWDLICDYGIFRDLQRHRIVDDLEWQQLTPRFGYEIPPLVEEASLTDLFEQCFDLSLGLYSALQAANYAVEAQYATLLGHKMRWKVTYNAREAFHLHELRTSPQGHPGYRKLVIQMHEKLAEVHPMLAEAMKFVNTGEDEELTRLAAERYTQFKLQQLQ